MKCTEHDGGDASLKGNMSRKLMKAFGRRTPGLFRRFQIQVLLDLAADTFNVPSEKVWIYPAGKALRKYAAFTERCMEQGEADPKRIYSKAFSLGEKVREKTGLTDNEDLQRLVFLLYRNISITMEGKLPGDIIVPQCYFSRFYTPKQCGLMSLVDSGVVAGIMGGGHLIFSQRITEGCACCRAYFNADADLEDGFDHPEGENDG